MHARQTSYHSLYSQFNSYILWDGVSKVVFLMIVHMQYWVWFFGTYSSELKTYPPQKNVTLGAYSSLTILKILNKTKMLINCDTSVQCQVIQHEEEITTHGETLNIFTKWKMVICTGHIRTYCVIPAAGLLEKAGLFLTESLRL